ncbi:MAG: hypothetical protein WCT24_01415 [Patescibacteria group bacterium]|jgi:hypothetical protein
MAKLSRHLPLDIRRHLETEFADPDAQRLVRIAFVLCELTERCMYREITDMGELLHHPAIKALVALGNYIGADNIEQAEHWRPEIECFSQAEIERDYFENLCTYHGSKAIRHTCALLIEDDPRERCDRLLDVIRHTRDAVLHSDPDGMTVTLAWGKIRTVILRTCNHRGCIL